MNVRCDRCGTVYRVDPTKVAAGGTMARCARCPGVFLVVVEAGGPIGATVPAGDRDRAGWDEGVTGLPEGLDDTERVDLAPAPAARGVDTVSAAPEGGPVPDEGGSREGAPDAGQAEGMVAEPPPAGSGVVGPSETPLPAVPEGPAAAPPPSDALAPATAPARVDADDSRDEGFGSGNPHDRARRLARALVSDIVAYHAERRDRALRDGRLRLELATEIRKSWETYSAQVGNQIARETSYFRDALNEILARGQRLF